VETTFLSPTADGRIDVAELEQLLRQQPTRLVVLSHASNVTGVVQPIAAATAAAQAAGARILIDAAQTAGHLPLSFDELGIDFLACSGHKGLLGPLGTGLLLVRAELQLELQPYRQGGTGTQSELEDLASGGPDRFEAGNHNAPGLFGLAAALEWLEHQTITGRHAAEQEMLGLLLTGLASLPGIELYPGPEPTASAGRIGVISLRLERLAPQILATLLDEHFGIEARAGLHCAPRAHLALGTLQGGGTLRLSPGAFTTVDEIDETLQALGQIALSV
jgi:selenocysteine lyase/cysteine desulfurase